jgi:aarF domain-containing kinase
LLQAFPYIAKRLMTDDSPRLREALRYMVYGKDGVVFDADRIIDLLDAFETFSEASRSARGDLDLPDPLAGLPPSPAAAAAGSPGGGGSAAGSPGGGGSAAAAPGYSSPFPFPSGGGGQSSSGGFGPAGQLAGALSGMAAAPLLALGSGGALGGPLASMDLEDTRTRDSLRCVTAAACVPCSFVRVCASVRRAGGIRGQVVSGDFSSHSSLPFRTCSPAHAAVPRSLSSCLPSSLSPVLLPPILRSFLFSPEGGPFREFLLDELVKSIDALSRDQLRALLGMLGLQNAVLPVLLPGANRCVAYGVWCVLARGPTTGMPEAQPVFSCGVRI